MYCTDNNFPQYDIGFLVFILQDRGVLNTKNSQIYMVLMIWVWANNLELDFAVFSKSQVILWLSLGKSGVDKLIQWVAALQDKIYAKCTKGESSNK